MDKDEILNRKIAVLMDMSSALFLLNLMTEGKKMMQLLHADEVEAIYDRITESVKRGAGAYITTEEINFLTNTDSTTEWPEVINEPEK